MRLRSFASILAACVLAAPASAPAAASAQEPGGPTAKPLGPADIIMPHITDSKVIEYPCVRSLRDWACEATLPTWNVTIAGKTVDMGPTKHVVFLALAGAICLILLLSVAAAHKRNSEAIGRPKGFAAGVEGIILYLRNEIYKPALGGHGGEKFVPFCLTLFFFILFCNLLGLLPWGSTPTGNLGVTATLAIVTFFVVEIAGMRALGAGYVRTIVYWPHEGGPMLKLMTIIMTPVEIVGKFTKPFALTIRLFANMISGHVIILALIGIIFLFGWKVFIGPIAMALFIMALELMVAAIQAFIFSLLAAVFIGQIRTAEH
jgi:F-type H+-transporting ATPase subunit a